MTCRTATPATRRTPWLRIVTVLLVTVGALLALPRSADAHAVLQATVPADGDAVPSAPGEVTLQFNEPVTAPLGAVRVYDTAAERVDLGDAGNVPGDPTRLRVGMPEDLPEGTYVATWSAISADSHPVSGAFVFTVGDAAAVDDDLIARIFATSGTEGPGFAIAASGLRFLTYAGALLAVGGTIFLLYVHGRQPGERRPLSLLPLAGAGTAAVATLLGIPVQGALVTGLGAAALLDPAVLGEVLTSSYGAAGMVRLAGLAVLLAALPRLWSTTAVVASGLGAATVLGSFALTGHTATTDPRWLVVGANLSHTLAAAAWFGGLVLLLVALRGRRLADDPVGGGRLVARFSTLATGAIVLVSAAGLGLAWAQVRALRALTSTTYGWALLGKLAIVAVVVAVGAYNHRRLVPAIARGAGDAWQVLRRTVRVEVIGLVAVVAVTAVLVNLVPARTAAGVTGAYSTFADLGEQYQINLTVDPNRAGTNEVHVYLLGLDGRPADVDRDLTLGFSLPAEDIGPIEREALVAGPGHWLLTGPELSIPGTWEIEVRVRVDDFQVLRTTVPVTVNP